MVRSFPHEIGFKIDEENALVKEKVRDLPTGFQPWKPVRVTCRVGMKWIVGPSEFNMVYFSPNTQEYLASSSRGGKGDNDFTPR
jgi:hypothetical protein